MNDFKIRVKSRKFAYKDNISMVGNNEGIIKSSDKPHIMISTPAEFGGKEGTWTPEDLFVASVNSCIMTTFSYYAEKRGFDFVSYESSAEGLLELVEMRYTFTEITIKPKITVKAEEDIETAERLLETSEKSCIISNSMKPKIVLNPEVVLAS